MRVNFCNSELSFCLFWHWCWHSKGNTTEFLVEKNILVFFESIVVKEQITQNNKFLIQTRTRQTITNRENHGLAKMTTNTTEWHKQWFFFLLSFWFLLSDAYVPYKTQCYSDDANWTLWNSQREWLLFCGCLFDWLWNSVVVRWVVLARWSSHRALERERQSLQERPTWWERFNATEWINSVLQCHSVGRVVVTWHVTWARSTKGGIFPINLLWICYIFCNFNLVRASPTHFASIKSPTFDLCEKNRRSFAKTFLWKRPGSHHSYAIWVSSFNVTAPKHISSITVCPTGASAFS